MVLLANSILKSLCSNALAPVNATPAAAVKFCRVASLPVNALSAAMARQGL